MKRKVVGLIAALPFALGVGVAQAHEGQWGQPGESGGSSSTPLVALAGVVTSAPDTAGNIGANVFMPRGDAYGNGAGCTSGSSQGSDESQGSEDNQGSDESQGSADNQGSDQGQGSEDSQGSSSTTGDDDAQSSAQSQSSGTEHSDWSGGDSGQGSPSGGDAYSAPSLTPATIPTDGATAVRLDGQPSSVSALAPGDRFVALFNGTPCDSISTLTSHPAVAISAHSPQSERQLYAFVGTLQSVDTTAHTITVNVTNSLPSGLSGPTTFSVSDATAILGGSSSNGLFGGSLSNLTPGDVVAGAEFGPAGQSFSQVESTPLAALVDFPATTTSGTTMSPSARRQARTRAFEQALAMFGHRSARATKHHATQRHVRRGRRVRAHRHAGR